MTLNFLDMIHQLLARRNDGSRVVLSFGHHKELLSVHHRLESSDGRMIFFGTGSTCAIGESGLESLRDICSVVVRKEYSYRDPSDSHTCQLCISKPGRCEPAQWRLTAGTVTVVVCIEHAEEKELEVIHSVNGNVLFRQTMPVTKREPIC